MDILNMEVTEKCKEKLASADKDLFEESSKIVKEFLAGEPFSQFEESMYFHRYLQWKWLERSVISTLLLTLKISQRIFNFFLHPKHFFLPFFTNRDED